jgi:uncharacterized protein (TIGR02996 family)
MSEHDALVQAILAAPDDDTPRLVYADWLDDHGDPARAEFIRAQCAIARLPEDDVCRPELEAREIQLLAKNAPEWAAPCPPCQSWEYAGDPAPRAVFRRGLVETVDALEALWPSKQGLAPDGLLSRMFAGHPVRELNIETRAADLEALAEWEALRQIEALSLGRYRTGRETAEWEREQDRRIENVLRSSNLARLRKLSCAMFAQTEEETVRCFRLPVMAQLVALRWWAQPEELSKGLVAEGACPHLRELETFTSNRPADLEAANRLIESDTWKRLTALGVHAPASFPWARALANASLQKLAITRTAASACPALVQALLGQPGQGAPFRGEQCLEELLLQGPLFTPEELGRVLGSDALAGLRRLSFVWANLTDDHLEEIAYSPVLAHLEHLTLALHHEAGDRGLRALLASPRLSRLTRLVIRGRASAEAARALAANGACRRLRALSFGAIDAAVLDALTRGEAFPDLHTFGMGAWRPSLPPQSLATFLVSPKFPRLCAVPLSLEVHDADALGEVLQGCERIAWAGGEMGDGGDGVRVALTPANVYLPNHLDAFAE